jgi:hypothetical protein
MPLTTYTPGEVLTAASLNDNFTFADNPPGGLELISTTRLAQRLAALRCQVRLVQLMTITELFWARHKLAGGTLGMS